MGRVEFGRLKFSYSIEGRVVLSEGLVVVRELVLASYLLEK